MSNFDKIMKVINKYSLLFGGLLSVYNIYGADTTFEMLAWSCSSLFALSGFAQIVELEKKLKDNEDDIPG